MDPYFKVELAIVREMSQSKDGKQLLSFALKLMPTLAHVVAPKAVLTSLDNIKGGELYMLSPMGAQGKLQVVQKMLMTLSNNTFPPEVKAEQTDERMKLIVERFQLFLRNVEKIGDKLVVETGTTAWASLFTHLKAASAKTNINAELITKLQTYIWLAPSDADVQELNRIEQTLQTQIAQTGKDPRATAKNVANRLSGLFIVRRVGVRR